MKTHYPLIIAIVALATAVYGVFRTPERVPSQAEGTQLQANSSQAAPASTPVAAISTRPQAAPIVSQTSAGEEALLRDIQNRLFNIENNLANMKSGWEGLARRGLVPLSEEDKVKYQNLALNASLPIEERLEALRLLRRHNAVTDQVAQTLSQFALSSTDPDIKGEIFEQMDGLTNSVLQGVLLTALADEQDAGVRRRIADALSPFSSDPDVQAWLRHLTETDPDERVKREASQALNQRLERMTPTELQQLVMNSDVTTSEKLSALGRLRREDARTPEVVASMVDLVNQTEDARTRVEIFRQLDGVTDPALVQPLLNGLAQDENARVREEAADTLAAYKSNPDVAAWLKYAAENDPDPRVKRQAQASLDGSEEGRGGREDFRERFERGGRRGR